MMDSKEPVMTSGSRSPLAPPAAREVAAQFARPTVTGNSDGSFSMINGRK